MFDNDDNSKWRSYVTDKEPQIKINFRDKATIDEVVIKRTEYDYTDLCFR